MVGVSRSPLSRSVRRPRTGSDNDSQRFMDAVRGSTSGSAGAAFGGGYGVPRRAEPVSTGQFGGYTERDAQRFVDAVRASGSAAPAVSAPRAGFGGYTETDAQRFMDAIRADTNAGAAFGAGYDPLRVPAANRISDENWFNWQAEQAARQQMDADAVAAQQAASAAAAERAAAAAAQQAELDRLAGAYSGAITGLEGELGNIGTTYAGLMQGVTDLYGGQEQGVRDLFAGYGTQLADMGTAAQGRIDAATLQAMERLAAIDPEAGSFQWNVQAGGVPTASSVDYLQAIGASPREVEAAQMLGQQLIAQQLGQAQQFAAGTQAGLERERAARQAASGLLSQQATGRLASQQAAYGAQLSAGELARVQALQQAGLSESQALRLAQQQEEERIRNAILQARLDAAAAGVAV
jgi:hypothetical protein